MTEKSLNYARDLHNLANAETFLQSSASMIEAVPAIGEELSDPTVSIAKKHMVIDRIFPHEIRNFFKLLCDNGDFDLFDEICTAYKETKESQVEKVKSARLRFVSLPTDEQLAGIKKFLVKEFGNEDIEIDLVQDLSLKSGFILSVGTKEYDWSEQGRINHVFFANWKNHVQDDSVEVIPLLDETDPWGDLRVRLGFDPDPKTGECRRPLASDPSGRATRDRKFAILTRFPTPGFRSAARKSKH